MYRNTCNSCYYNDDYSMMITMNAVVIITADVTVMMTRPNHAQVLVTAKWDQQDLEVKEVQ